MNSFLTFGIVCLSLVFGWVNFPCEDIYFKEASGVIDFTCSEVGWCYPDESGGNCYEDTCVKKTDSECSADSNCKLGYQDYDTDCATGEHVNKKGLHCLHSGHSDINKCFYDFLKNGNCGSGCRLVTLDGKEACIYQYTEVDECNGKTELQCTEDINCFMQGGKCVKDVCRFDGDGWTGSLCEPNTTCVGRDRYEPDFEADDDSYIIKKVCMDPNHTIYDKCDHIQIYEFSPTGVGDCVNQILHSDWCTEYAGCKVVTFEHSTQCSSLDLSGSASSVIQIPSFFAFLVLSVFALAFSV